MSMFVDGVRGDSRNGAACDAGTTVGAAAVDADGAVGAVGAVGAAGAVGVGAAVGAGVYGVEGATGATGAAAERIIVALDCAADEALRLADQLAGSARWLKVGMTLYYAVGPAIVQKLKQQGFKVFVDLKLHDIPHQVQGAAAAVAAAGADMLTVHGAGGLAMMRAAADAIQLAWSQATDGLAAVPAAKAIQPAPGQARPISLAITVLTSMDAASLEQVGVARPLDEQVRALAVLARQAGLDGVVASPNEAAALRGLLGPDAAIVTPGVRPAGSGSDDQSRVATPAAAIAAGASHLVIGRPITAAADPLAAFNQIAAEVGAAFPCHRGSDPQSE